MILYVLVGPPASGKSTWIDKNTSSATVVSPDVLRAQLCSCQDLQTVVERTSCQKHNDAVFDQVFKLIAEAARNNVDVVVDSTALRPGTRREYVSCARAAAPTTSLKAVAVLFKVSLPVLWWRNRRRERTVPFHVLKNMWKTARGLTATRLIDEGFDRVDTI